MRNKTLIYLIIGLTVSVLFSSCHKGRKVLSRDKMEAVLYDMQLAQAVYDSHRRDFDSDEKKKALFDAVLEKHNVTQAALDSSLVYYADDMKTYLKMNDSIASRLKQTKRVLDRELEQKKSLEERYEERKKFASFYYLTAAEPTYSFRLDSANTNNIDIPSLRRISFRTLGESPDVTLFSSVRLQYADTSIVVPFTADAETFTYQVDILPFDTIEHTLRALSGYVHAKSPDSKFTVLVHSIRFAENDSIPNVLPSATAEDNTQLESRNLQDQ